MLPPGFISEGLLAAPCTASCPCAEVVSPSGFHYNAEVKMLLRKHPEKASTPKGRQGRRKGKRKLI